MGICQTKIEKRREQLEDSGDDMTPSKERLFFDAIKERLFASALQLAVVCRAPLSSQIPMGLWKFSDPAMEQDSAQLQVHRRRSRVRDGLAKSMPY